MCLEETQAEYDCADETSAHLNEQPRFSLIYYAWETHLKNGKPVHKEQILREDIF
jgi:hypothetical protein